jgi:hypothetical protein
MMAMISLELSSTVLLKVLVRLLLKDEVQVDTPFFINSRTSISGDYLNPGPEIIIKVTLC